VFSAVPDSLGLLGKVYSRVTTNNKNDMFELWHCRTLPLLDDAESIYLNGPF